MQTGSLPHDNSVLLQAMRYAKTFDLPLSRADIADFLGLTIETVSRQMTKLRKDGLIAVENNRHVTVFDVDKLERRANV